MKRAGALNTIAAGLFAGLAAIGTMIAWRDIQPVIIDTTAAIGATLTPGGSWIQDTLEHLVIPGLPIIAPVLVFILVYLGVSRMMEARR